MQAISELLQATEGAAKTMQRLVRGRLARGRLCGLMRLLGALRLQRVFRGHRVRVALRHSHAYPPPPAAGPWHPHPHPFPAPNASPASRAAPVETCSVAPGPASRHVIDEKGVEDDAVFVAGSQDNDAFESQTSGGALPTITYAFGAGRARVYWESGGGSAMVGSWASALWAPPALPP